MTADLITAHPVLDAWRVIMMAASLWLTMLLLRLAWHRWREDRAGVVTEAPHWTTYLSYALAMEYCGFRSGVRLGDDLGEPTFVLTLVVGLGFYGVSKRVTFHRPRSVPGGRRPRDRH